MRTLLVVMMFASVLGLVVAACPAFVETVAECAPDAAVQTENTIRDGSPGWVAALRVLANCIPIAVKNIRASKDNRAVNASSGQIDLVGARLDERVKMADEIYNEEREKRRR